MTGLLARNTLGAPPIRGRMRNRRRDVRVVKPDLRTIAGKAQSAHQSIQVSRFALGEIDRTSGPHLGDPNIQGAAAIGEKRHKASVRGDGRIALHTLKVGQPRECRIGERIRFGRRWAVSQPSGHPAGGQ